MGLHPKTLLSGTLHCEHCGKPLALTRGGVVNFYGCTYGHKRAGGCPLRNKKVAIVEAAILEYIRYWVLGEENLKRLVDQANDFLHEEASKPRIDPRPVKAQIDSIGRAIGDLTDALLGRPATVKPIVDRIEAYETERGELRKHLLQIETRNSVKATPLTLDLVKTAAGRLSEILNQEPSAVAPVLRDLTGPIHVSARDLPGRKRPIWVGRFRAQLIPLLARMAKTNAPETPDSYGLDFLTVRKWSFVSDHEVVISQTRLITHKAVRYVAIADDVVRLIDQGCGLSAVMRQLNAARDTVGRAYYYGKTGERPSVTATANYAVTTLHMRQRSALRAERVTQQLQRMGEVLPNAVWDEVASLFATRHTSLRRQGRYRTISDRKVLSAILFVLKTGIAHSELPSQLRVDYSIVWDRLNLWAASGALVEISKVLRRSLPWLADADLKHRRGSWKILLGKKPA
jgi:transposase